jgi:hypothetical protein
LNDEGRSFFSAAAQWVAPEDCSRQAPILDVLLTAALIRTVRGLPSLAKASIGLRLEDLESALSKRLVSDFPVVSSGRWNNIGAAYHPAVIPFIVLMKASEALVELRLGDSSFPSEGRKMGVSMAEAGLLRGWKLLAFYLRRLPGKEDRELDIFALAKPVGSPRSGEMPMDLVPTSELGSLVQECTSAVLANLEPSEKMDYVVALVDWLSFAHPEVEVSAVRNGVEHVIGKSLRLRVVYL